MQQILIVCLLLSLALVSCTHSDDGGAADETGSEEEKVETDSVFEDSADSESDTSLDTVPDEDSATATTK